MPLPGAGAPPAPQAPRGTGRHRPYLTTFRRPDAKRHRRPWGAFSYQLPTTPSQKMDVPACDCRHNLLWWRWNRALDSASRAFPPPSRPAAQLVDEQPDPTADEDRPDKAEAKNPSPSRVPAADVLVSDRNALSGLPI